MAKKTDEEKAAEAQEKTDEKEAKAAAKAENKVTGFRFRSGKADCNPTLNGIVFESNKVYTALTYKKAVSAGTGQATAERVSVKLDKSVCKKYIDLLKKKYPKLSPSFEPVKAAELID